MLAIDIVITGLVLGGMYALTAMGLTLQYGVARIVNLAYGEFLLAAALLTYWLYTSLSVSPLIALLVVVPLSFVVNWLVYKVMLVPLVRRAKSPGMLEGESILATFGLLFVIQGLAVALFGSNLISYSYLSIPVSIFGSIVPINRLLAFGFAVAIGVVVYALLTRTRGGTALRAVAANPTAARLVAIDVGRASAFAFALGGAMVAAGGVLISMYYTFNASLGVVFTMKALIIVIMGGVGNLMGALAAGLLLGLAETAVARLYDPGLTLAMTYALFIAVLLIRPSGLLGRAAR